MTKFARMIDVLDLYSESDTLLSAEDIAERLQVSRPTAFRYVRELSHAGFLANYGGRYSLGARIITLDYRIREADPVLKVARTTMQQLAAETSHGIILCRMYNHDIINVHHEMGYDRRTVSFGRGRPLPLFRGAVSKVMLAFLPTNRLRRLYEAHADHPDVSALAADWPAFRRYYASIRQQGHYISDEEVESDVVGIAAPVAIPDNGMSAALCLVVWRDRLDHVNLAGTAELVMRRAQHIGAALASLGQTAAEPPGPVVEPGRAQGVAHDPVAG